MLARETIVLIDSKEDKKVHLQEDQVHEVAPNFGTTLIPIMHTINAQGSCAPISNYPTSKPRKQVPCQTVA
jgi:hypothetical protein